MRELTDHVVPGGDDLLLVAALDDSHDEYVIAPRESPFPGLDPDGYHSNEWAGTRLPFQHGPIKGDSVNGISNEALIAIVLDRLLGFQAGPLRCVENETAIKRLQGALAALKKRTRDRMARGVEGTNEP